MCNTEFDYLTAESREQIMEAVHNASDDFDCSPHMIGSNGADFAPAIMGVDAETGAIVYNGDSMIPCFMAANDWTEEEAAEWYSFNTLRGLPYLKPETMIEGKLRSTPVPIIVNSIDFML